MVDLKVDLLTSEVGRLALRDVSHLHPGYQHTMVTPLVSRIAGFLYRISLSATRGLRGT